LQLASGRGRVEVRCEHERTKLRWQHQTRTADGLRLRWLLGFGRFPSGFNRCLRRCERPVRAITYAVAVGGNDAEVVGGARAQAADASRHILVCVTGFGLGRSCGPVASRRAVLKMHACAQSVRIDRAVQCR